MKKLIVSLSVLVAFLGAIPFAIGAFLAGVDLYFRYVDFIYKRFFIS